MISARYETYQGFPQNLPFILNSDIQRSLSFRSAQPNWHDNVELQLCTQGEGTVLINGLRYPFGEGDIVAVNSNTIHYTSTESQLTYSCLIISTDFCRQMGIDYERLSFSPRIQDPELANLFRHLIQIYHDESTTMRIAQLNKLLLELLIALGKDHILPASSTVSGKASEAVKNTLTYVRMHYASRITLDAIAKEVIFDKFALCREFRKITGQTIFGYLNLYRCLMATQQIENGASVSEAATSCGFENLSFFTKTFKHYMGKLPSACKPNT